MYRANFSQEQVGEERVKNLPASKSAMYKPLVAVMISRREPRRGDEEKRIVPICKIGRSQEQKVFIEMILLCATNKPNDDLRALIARRLQLRIFH